MQMAGADYNCLPQRRGIATIVGAVFVEVCHNVWSVAHGDGMVAREHRPIGWLRGKRANAIRIAFCPPSARILTGPWDIKPRRARRDQKRVAATIVAGIVVGVAVGFMVPSDALRIGGAGFEPEVATPVVPERETARPRREDTPLAPPPAGGAEALPGSAVPSGGAAVSARFSFCSGGGGDNCVVDGDTFRHRGDKIRIADIDTPELNPARCAAEEELGQAAKARLRDLLNAGAFTLEPVGGRGSDNYGRKLRVVMRDGRSLGDQLVSEGLARTWTGRRQPWC